jgi:hypothetical protein
MFLSITTGLLFVRLSGWTVLTVLCAASVLVNLALVVGTVVRMLRVRLRLARRAEAPGTAYSEGGGG